MPSWLKPYAHLLNSSNLKRLLWGYIWRSNLQSPFPAFVWGLCCAWYVLRCLYGFTNKSICFLLYFSWFIC